MAGKIKNMKDLEQAIAVIEEKRAFEWLEIKATAEAATESLKPANLVRQVISEFMADRDFRKILKHAASIGAGLAVQKASVSKNSGTFVKFIGRMLQMSVTAILDRMLVKK